MSFKLRNPGIVQRRPTTIRCYTTFPQKHLSLQTVKTKSLRLSKHMSTVGLYLDMNACQCDVLKLRTHVTICQLVWHKYLETAHGHSNTVHSIYSTVTSLYLHVLKSTALCLELNDRSCAQHTLNPHQNILKNQISSNQFYWLCKYIFNSIIARKLCASLYTSRFFFLINGKVLGIHRTGFIKKNNAHIKKAVSVFMCTCLCHTCKHMFTLSDKLHCCQGVFWLSHRDVQSYLPLNVPFMFLTSESGWKRTCMHVALPFL